MRRSPTWTVMRRLSIFADSAARTCACNRIKSRIARAGQRVALDRRLDAIGMGPVAADAHRVLAVARLPRCLQIAPYQRRHDTAGKEPGYRLAIVAFLVANCNSVPTILPQGKRKLSLTRSKSSRFATYHVGMHGM